MTPELVRELSKYPQFPKSAHDLIRIVGIGAATELMTAWGGQEYPVPKVVGGANKHGASRYGQVVDLIGEEASEALVGEFGGQKVSIPNLKMVLWSYTQDQMRREYEGLIASGMSNPDAVFDLGVRYRINGRAVERIVNAPYCYPGAAG